MDYKNTMIEYMRAMKQAEDLLTEPTFLLVQDEVAYEQYKSKLVNLIRAGQSLNLFNAEEIITIINLFNISLSESIYANKVKKHIEELSALVKSFESLKNVTGANPIAEDLEDKITDELDFLVEYEEGY